MADDTAGVSYVYKNVGLQIDPTKDQPGVSYVYKNVGVSGFVNWHIGSIQYRIDDEYGVSYIYKNVQ